MRIRRYLLRELYVGTKVVPFLKTRIVKAEAIEALLYGCSAWILHLEHYSKLGAAQETKPWDDLVQPCPRNNAVGEQSENIAHEKPFVSEGAHPIERRVVVKANHVRKP